jgi:DNA-binding NarL/FixJ family response regulator
VATVARTRPHAVVLDVRTPPCDRLDALPRLTRLTRVIAVSHSTDPHLVTRALNAGAVAFLVHGEYSAAQLVRALAEAHQANVHLSAPTAAAAARLIHNPTRRQLPPAESATRDQLSRRESEVMDRVARGLTNGEIARCLGLSEKTVKAHINRIFAKLQVTTRARAIVLWLNAPRPL